MRRRFFLGVREEIGKDNIGILQDFLVDSIGFDSSLNIDYFL